MTFGGLWPIFNAPRAMREFGFPAKTADAPAAAPVMTSFGSRTTIIGVLVFLLYSRNQLDLVDQVMAVTGAWAGLVDCCVLWKEGKPRKGMFRLVSSWLISAWGFAGLTTPSK